MAKRSELAWETWVFPTESKFRDYVTRRFKELLLTDACFMYQKISDRYTAGISDFLCCVNGSYVALELKQPGRKPTELQLHYLAKVRKAGGYGNVCYNWKQVKRLLKDAGLGKEYFGE